MSRFLRHDGEYQVRGKNGDLVGYYAVKRNRVEDHSTGRHVETWPFPEVRDAHCWASDAMDDLYERTVEEAPEGDKDDYSTQVVKSG